MNTTILFIIGIFVIGVIVFIYGYRILYSPKYLEYLRKGGWRDENNKVSDEFQDIVAKYSGWTSLGIGIFLVGFAIWLIINL